MVAALEESPEVSTPDGLLGVAAEYATESVPVARRDERVGEVRGQLVGREFRCAEDAAFLGFALIGWGDVEVAVAVALAMFASCSIATIVATALPAAFQHLGKDPAFGSGPLATVFQDLLSIAVYLAIVVAVVV
jgi:Mg/Co/Ni transporter MgtE